MNNNPPANMADNNDLLQLEKQLQLMQLQVNSLLEVTQAINNNLSSEKLFRIYEFILRAQISVSKLVVYLKEDDEFYCICRYGGTIEANENELLDKLFSFQKLTFLENGQEPMFEGYDIVIPVFHKKEPLAFALLAKPEVKKHETLDEKINFIQTITNIIVVAIENKKLFKRQLEQEKLQRELELAAQVQSLLIPKNLPDNDKLQLSAVYLPHHDIGGDYYDYIELNEEEVMFAIADVSGKGIAAAILMANFQAILRALLKTMDKFEEYVKSLNESVTEITKGERFITLFVAKYNSTTKKLTYINAGHNPPVLYSDGKIHYLDTGCTILGMFEEIPFIHTGELTLEKDSVLINYTDGLTDLENNRGENFSLHRITEFLRKNNEMDMFSLNQKLLEEIVAFKEEMLYVDDISILSCRFR